MVSHKNGQHSYMQDLCGSFTKADGHYLLADHLKTGQQPDNYLLWSNWNLSEPCHPCRRRRRKARLSRQTETSLKNHCIKGRSLKRDNVGVESEEFY
jgi:hypothetical protein